MKPPSSSPRERDQMKQRMQAAYAERGIMSLLPRRRQGTLARELGLAHAPAVLQKV